MPILQYSTSFIRLKMVEEMKFQRTTNLLLKTTKNLLPGLISIQEVLIRELCPQWQRTYSITPLYVCLPLSSSSHISCLPIARVCIEQGLCRIQWGLGGNEAKGLFCPSNDDTCWALGVNTSKNVTFVINWTDKMRKAKFKIKIT